MSEAATLPVWDLSDLFPRPDGPEVDRALARVEAAARAFRERWQGKLGALDAKAFATAIGDYESLQDEIGRLLSYAQLRYAQDMSDAARGRFHQTVQERVNRASAETLFFTLEINQLPEDAMVQLALAPEVARYAPWLRDVRVWRPHQLAEELERLLHEKRVAGRGAWNRLFDETIAALRFPVGGRELSSQEALHLLSSPDAAVRREAAKAIGGVLGANARLFAHITNTLAKDKEIEDRWRRFPEPHSARNLANLVEDEVVEALVAAVVDAYPRLSHRYYRLKAQWMGTDMLDYWDRNAPLPEADEREIPWDEAARLVLDAYGAFSGELAAVARRFFEGGWIDAPAHPGKAPGAFAHPTVPSAHPYLLLNYQGKLRDVMTLAHELGHGVHQVLAARQGPLMARTPLTLAETASVFGEMLTFRALLGRETEPRKRRIMLAAKVEDMLNTVVRQIAFYRFERALHRERRSGELSQERICALWMETQAESLGPALRFDEEYRWYWAYIPHFIHSPFYVYAYAFGDCLVNSLYAVYEDSHEGFARNYLALLGAGGTLRHRELLAPFGLDASDPAFWQRGLGLIERLIDEIEAAEPEARQ